jgi:hypothetical protein
MKQTLKYLFLWFLPLRGCMKFDERPTLQKYRNRTSINEND